MKCDAPCHALVEILSMPIAGVTCELVPGHTGAHAATRTVKGTEHRIEWDDESVRVERAVPTGRR